MSPFRSTFKSRVLALAVSVLAVALAFPALAGAPDAQAQPPAPVTLTAEPGQLEIRPCLLERLRLVISNDSAQARVVDVQVTAEAPVEVSRKFITTYVPAHGTVSVDMHVTAARDASTGDFELLAETGGRGRPERLAVPVTVVSPSGARCLPREDMTASATSAQQTPDYGAHNALDGNEATLWHTRYSPTRDALPQSITVDLGGSYDLADLVYQPRVDGNLNGVITAYNLLTSTDGQTFSQVASGTWALDSNRKAVAFDAPGTRFVRLEATEGRGGFASAAEIVMFGRPTPDP